GLSRSWLAPACSLSTVAHTRRRPQPPCDIRDRGGCITATVLSSGKLREYLRSRPGAGGRGGTMDLDVGDGACRPSCAAVRLAGLGAAGAKAAVLELVAARGHVAPCALSAVRPVVERPEAIRVPAQLHPVPAAVGLRVADGQQQPGQPVGQAPAVFAALQLD